MKERRAGERADAPYSEDEFKLEREKRRRQWLAGLDRAERATGPCKVTRYEVELARAERSPSMAPDAALSYAAWLLEPARGWQSADTATVAPFAVMRSAEGDQLRDDVPERLAEARRGGQPLDAQLRPMLEAALGAPLDEVRVYLGSEADAAARALDAKAFAVGQDVFFRSDSYDPQTREGQRLIAHEVAHTVQARGADPLASGGTTVSRPDDAPEREADAFADAFVDSFGGHLEEARRPFGASAPASTRAVFAPLFTRQIASIHRTRDSKQQGKRPQKRGPEATKSTPQTSTAAPTTTTTTTQQTSSQTTASKTTAKTGGEKSRQNKRQPPVVTQAGNAATTTTTTSATTTNQASGAGNRTSGSDAGGSSSDFSKRIRAAADKQRQELTTKAHTVRSALGNETTAARERLTTGFSTLLQHLETSRTKALTDLHTRSDATKLRVRQTADAELGKLDAALTRQQAAVRRSGEDVAREALQQASAQGTRVTQGSSTRAQRARSIGSSWSAKFQQLEGGGDVASEVTSKSGELASEIERGARDAMQTCVEHGQELGDKIREDAGEVASGMTEKLDQARDRIGQDRDDAIAAIDDGIASARDGIEQSFEETRRQLEDKKKEALESIVQLGESTARSPRSSTRSRTSPPRCRAMSTI